ncbi:hypothetical protein ACFVP0_27730 [Streptomyces cinereoruber]|uniref:hypothetical protein n=1 Tax=Streptomyces cinereoruber TaxID=67260 RepID=UPI0036C6FFEA
MPLFAEQFFDDHLALPYAEAAVVGGDYYARPTSALPLRLRISFADGRVHQRYEGLRLQIVHLEQGRIDAQFLSFAEYDAFRARDARLGNRPGSGEYGSFTDWRSTDAPPWTGIDVTRLRTAIGKYVQIWVPGAPTVRTAPLSVASTPAPPASIGIPRRR